MSDAFGWAHFGDVGGRHALIDATGIDGETLSAIRWHTDLPPDAPTTWASFYAGYAIRGYYVIQFTKPDAGASRPGMVKTTLAAVRIDWLSEVKLPDLRSHAMSTNNAATSPISCDRIEGLGAVLDMLAESRPVYWLGTSTYDALLDQLWDVLNAADRTNLVFGLLFTPSSVPYPSSDTTFGVYLVPERFRARFDSTCTIDADNPPRAEETSQAVLDGDSGIAAELGLASPSLREWRHLARLRRYLDKASHSHPDRIRACAHLLKRLAPDPQSGRTVKAQVAALLVESSANASFPHIRGLRTLNLADLGVDIDALLESWAAAVVGDPNRINDLQAALDEVAAKPFDHLCGSINTALDKQVKARGQALVDYFETAMTSSRRAVFNALAHRVHPERIDAVLAAVDGIENREWVHEIAQQTRLPMTHSRSCPTGEPIKAFQAHLAIPGHSSESRAQLASRCEPRGVVDSAVALDARVLVDLAAEAVRQDTDVLLPARPGSRCWLAIWARVVEDGADPWTWLKPWDAMEPVFNAFLEGDDNVKSLVAALGASTDINLASYPRRSEVWSAVAEPARSRLLHRTAIAVVLDGSAIASLEPALRDAVVSREVMTAVAEIDVSKAVDAIDALARYADFRSAEAILAVADLDADAERFGRLVAREGWKNAARYIVAHASLRSDLAAAEATCRQIVSPWELLTIKFSSVGGGDITRLPEQPAAQNHMTSDMTPDRLDTLIVTALQLERRAVREHLTGIRTHHPGSAVVDIGRFAIDSSTMSVGVIECGPGNIDAAVLTTDTVRILRPRVVLMVGVAGGVKDVQIGDVVASSKIYWSEPGKSEGGLVKSRPDTGPVSAALVQGARAVAAEDSWQSRRRGDVADAPMPKVLVAPIVVGERVIASSRSADADRIRARFDDAVAVAMEDVGVTKSADAAGAAGLAIRGISDLLDDKTAADASGSQQTAAANAAAFAFELLTKLIHASTVGEHSQPLHHRHGTVPPESSK